MDFSRGSIGSGKGIKNLEMYYVYEYQLTNTTLKMSKGLFEEFINTFLKLIVKASGITSWVLCPEDEERYIHSCWKSEGVELNKSSIKYNAAKLGLANFTLTQCGDN